MYPPSLYFSVACCMCSRHFFGSPVIADGKLYLRDQELLFCFDVKEK